MGNCARALVVAALSALALAQGCGSGALPPALEDSPGSGDGGANGDAIPLFDASPQELTCDLGPEGGVCACLDLPLLTDVPNIYFVLDRSGSMAEFNKWYTVRNVLGQTIRALGPRINIGVAVFPNAKTGECNAGDEVLSVRQGDSPPGTVGPTAIALSGAVDTLAPEGGTPTAQTLVNVLPHLQALTGKTYVVLMTDGGPNCDGNAQCTVDQCIVNIESADPMCKPNTQPNCCTTDTYGPTQCLDTDATIHAVQALYAAGIPTYVVGVHGSGPYGTLLDGLATAGGTARASEPLYYAVDNTDASALASALSQIAAKITATCTLPINGTIDPSHLNVFFDGTVVPEDPNDGWTVDGNTVTLVGAACDKVLNGSVLDVRVVSGCPTVYK